jgi:hypothetical protein
MADPNSCIPSHNPRRPRRRCPEFLVRYRRRSNRYHLHWHEGKLWSLLLGSAPGEMTPVTVGVAIAPGLMRYPLRHGLSPWHEFALLLFQINKWCNGDRWILNAYYEGSLQCSQSQAAHLHSHLLENHRYATLCMCTELI